MKPRKSTSPKALEMQSSSGCNHLPILTTFPTKLLEVWISFHLSRQQGNPRSCTEAVMEAIPASTLDFDVNREKTLWKADSQIFIYGCCRNIHPWHSWLFSQLPTMKRRWWSKHRLFPEADGAGNSCPPQPAVSTRILAEVLLVIFLGVIKLGSLPDLRGDGAKASLCQHLEGKTGKAIRGLL